MSARADNGSQVRRGQGTSPSSLTYHCWIHPLLETGVQDVVEDVNCHARQYLSSPPPSSSPMCNLGWNS
eukprot:760392-Hanusia_phi.AAC.1